MAASSTKGIAVVTGASSGIGAVYADRLAGRGYDLILVARRADRLETLAGKIQKAYGRRVEVLTADLGKSADLERVAGAIAANPDVRVLVNNAGIARLAPVASAPFDHAREQIDINISALTRLTYAVLPGFVARNKGAIINIASVLGVETLPVSAVYSGTKAFVLSFGAGLQGELAETGVRVQTVAPAVTATEIWDNSGVLITNFDPSIVMTTEQMVDAALAGFDKGEAVTFPSVADESFWQQIVAARSGLFASARTGKPAPRYGVA